MFCVCCMQVKEKQEKDKIRSKPDKNGKQGCNFLSEELPDIDSFNGIHPYFDDNPLSGSTTYLSNSLLEEFGDELALITYPSDYDDNLKFDIESDLREIEFLLYQGKDSDLKDSIDQTDLANLDDYFVDPTPEMFTNEHAPDYSFPPRFDVYPDDFLEIESDADNFYDDPFNSKGEKIKEFTLLIDELDLPCDFLPYSEYDSFASQDFSRDDDLPSPDNEDKVFNPGILIQEKYVTIITRVAHEKKISISYASLVFEDFDPPFYEPLVFKDVPNSMRLLPFSFENEEKVFNQGYTLLRRILLSWMFFCSIFIPLDPPKYGEITSPEVTHEIHDSEGCNFLSEELPDIDSFNDIHPHFDDNPLSGSTTYSSNSLLEEFTDELALITYPLDFDDNLKFDIDFDLIEIEFLLYQGTDSDLKDSIDQTDLANLDDYFVDPTPEMFIDEHAPDYSFPPRFDVYPDDFLEIKSDADNFYNDPFDSKGEKIKEFTLLIDELDLLCDFIPYSEYDSFASQDFSRDDDLPSPDNEDKVFNSGILIQKKYVTIITRVAHEKKLAISYASLVFEDFDPPFYEPLVFKDVPNFPFSSENEEKVFKPGIYTSKKLEYGVLPSSGYGILDLVFFVVIELRLIQMARRVSDCRIRRIADRGNEEDGPDSRDEEEEYPFVNKYPSLQEPSMLVEEESCPVYDTDNEEESKVIYDTNGNDVDDSLEFEILYPDQGESLVIQWVLSMAPSKSIDDDSWN
nr:hypothetical protein [Tanacetum cinerariifolium]